MAKRRTRGCAIGAVLAAVLLAGLPVSTAQATPPAPDERTTVARLPILIPAAAALDAGYAFKSFRKPKDSADRGRKGCTRMDRALIKAAVKKPRVSGPDCRITGGVWIVDLGARKVRNVRKVRLVPAIDMQTAWAHGAFGWTKAQRRAFATTYPRVTKVSRAQQLADRPQASWLQHARGVCAMGRTKATSTPLGCGYVLLSAKRTVKPRTLWSRLRTRPGTVPCAQLTAALAATWAWGLTMDPDLQRAATGRARQCRQRPLALTRANPVNPIGLATSRNPYARGATIGSTLFGLHVPRTAPKPLVRYGSVRLWDSDVGWDAIEPSPGRYDWRDLDAAVGRAEAAGARVTYVFGRTPQWAAPRTVDPPKDMRAFDRYVTAVVQRYGNRIAAYEVWNEPNLRTYFSGSVDELVQMTRIVHTAVRSYGRGAITLAPSTTTRATESFYRFYFDYIRALGRAGWPVDGFAVHSYPASSRGPDARAAGLSLFRAMLDLAKAPDLPIYDTEVNYGLAGLNESKRSITGPEAQGYLAQTFIDSVRLGVQEVDWYLWSGSPFSLLGIQLDPSATAAIAAWQWTYDQLVGAQFLGCQGDGTAVTCEFTRTGRRYALAYASSIDTARISAPAGLDQVCTMDGACSAVTGPVTVGIRPVLLRSSAP